MAGAPHLEPAPGRLGVDAAVDAYVAAWNAPDDQDRRRMLERSVTGDCLFLGPTGRCHGIDAMHQIIGDARDFMPGASLVRLGGLDPAGDLGGWRFRWRVEGPEGQTVLEGADLVECSAEGRLRSIRVLSD